MRFPTVLSIGAAGGVVPFQDAIRSGYPFLEEERRQTATLGPNGVQATAVGPVIWRFSSADRAWRVSLGTDFLTLETVRYVSRQDLVDRLRLLLVALNAHIDPGVRTGTGLRYVDRVIGEELTDLAALVRPELLGIDATTLASRVSWTLTSG